MKPEHRELLMLALGDELRPAQREEFDRLLTADAGFRQEWEDLQKVQNLVSDARTESFPPFFAGRVMARIRDEQQDSLADGLVRLFRPLVPVSVALALALSLLNWQDRELMGEDASILEVAFAMPAASVESAELLDL
ncbi:hypothetical protein ACFL6X_02375 [Candidatus Latescibacterota bacterium]